MPILLSAVALLGALSYKYLAHNKQQTNALAMLTDKYDYPPDGKKDDAYFWFYVRVKVRTRDQIYKIISVGSYVKQGNLKQFNKAVWRGLSQRRIIIGPFITLEDAKKSQQLYKIIMRARSRDYLLRAKLPTYDHPVYWFALKFMESPRLRIFIVEHSPARVESGDARAFINALFETLTYQQIIIGPFEDYQRTEEIKRIYRRNE